LEIFWKFFKKFSVRFSGELFGKFSRRFFKEHFEEIFCKLFLRALLGNFLSDFLQIYSSPSPKISWIHELQALSKMRDLQMDFEKNDISKKQDFLTGALKN
jgi:hypothetical protein